MAEGTRELDPSKIIRRISGTRELSVADDEQQKSAQRGELTTEALVTKALEKLEAERDTAINTKNDEAYQVARDEVQWALDLLMSKGVKMSDLLNYDKLEKVAKKHEIILKPVNYFENLSVGRPDVHGEHVTKRKEIPWAIDPRNPDYLKALQDIRNNLGLTNVFANAQDSSDISHDQAQPLNTTNPHNPSRWNS